MKTVFLYSGPHGTHEAWAKSLDAEFVSNALDSGAIPNISRLIKTFTVQRKIPRDADLLLCEGGSELIAGALWKRKHPDKHLVLIVDDPKLFFLPGMSPVKKRLYYWALSYYDMLIPTSDFMQGFIPEEFRNKSRVVQLYVEDRYRIAEPAPLNSENLVFVGRVGMEKGVDLIIDAFRILKDDFPESKLFMVGDGPLKKELQKEEKDVIWTGELEDPMEYFLKGSIYINLARVEPFGVAILEAMCLGLVPIVTGCVGVSEFIKEISPQLVVKNAKEAGDIAKKLLSSPELFKEYSDKSIEVARDFRKEDSLNKFKEVIARL